MFKNSVFVGLFSCVSIPGRYVISFFNLYVSCCLSYRCFTANVFVFKQGIIRKEILASVTSSDVVVGLVNGGH